MRGPPVVLTNTLGRPVTNIISERGAVPMTVVNTLGEPVTLVNSGGEPVTLFNPNGTLWDYPFSLFANNEQGAWYDPSDFSTLYQNSTGTTPVTAVEQPVGLMLDRSRGLVLGAEAVSNGDFSNGGTGWSYTSWVISGGAATLSNASDSLAQSVSFVAGRTYAVTFTLSAFSGTGAFRPRIFGGTTVTGTNRSADGTYTEYMVAVTGNNQFAMTPSTATCTGTIDNISVRELPGNHASQATSASRPVLRSRYNLLTYSEEFNDAAWIKSNVGVAAVPTVTANAGTAPDGTATADRVQYSLNGGTASGDISNLYQTNTTTGALTHSVYLKSYDGVSSYNMQIVDSTGAGQPITVTGAWQRFSVSATSAGSTNYAIRLRGGATPTNSNTADVLLWGAQLLTAADQTSTGGAYQRIAAATDYDVSNPVWRPYLAFDGTDDSFSTSSIDFSGTDEMTVFAGVTKLSDAAVAIVMSYNGTSNASAEMFAPRNTTTNSDFAFSHRTTSVQEAGDGIPVLSPTTAVLTGVSDISAPFLELRRNGAVIETNTTALAANNYTSGTIRIGHRSSNLYLNGRLYSLAILGRTATAAEISAMEAWVNGKTGAY